MQEGVSFDVMDLGRVYRMAFRVSSVSLTDLVGLSIKG